MVSWEVCEYTHSFGSDISAKQKIIEFEISDDSLTHRLDTDEVMNADAEYS